MNSDHPSDTTANEFVSHYEWLTSLRPELRDLVLKGWDDTGRPITEQPVTTLLVDLAKLHAETGFDGFKADATATLVRFSFVQERDLERLYMMFMAGAIWGTITVQNMIRSEFANRPSNNNS